MRRVVDRDWHSWNHPTDAVRASCKLGVVSLLYAIKSDLVHLLRALADVTMRRASRPVVVCVWHAAASADTSVS